ncbi:MAG: 16S rRNA (adenine(1518)-N(6)/adenine(1519)-N(6))-dimethyltransferase RsmA, partial [Hyphomicrobiales bacterium]|nr:16S rRNA (adenine(1518)-N(6)/adenine(1519)-N(6))-dimethyltransferase RsmA [Hyphomicrobiales bacterium]
MDNLPPLRDVINRYGLTATRRLGQNFLLDLNLTARIARSAGDLDGETVVEVGPGPGGLTRALLAAGAARVVAIERDQRCLPALEDISARFPGRLSVVAGDALDIDYQGIAPPLYRIIANLPYNIATPLLVKWLQSEPWPPPFRSLTLMFQKEVAQRIVAEPRSKAYGRLGVLTGWRSEARIVFDISPRAFTP